MRMNLKIIPFSQVSIFLDELPLAEKYSARDVAAILRASAVVGDELPGLIADEGI